MVVSFQVIYAAFLTMLQENKPLVETIGAAAQSSHVQTLLDDDVDEDWEDNSFPLSTGDNKQKGGVSLVRAMNGKQDGGVSARTPAAFAQPTKQCELA